MNINELLTVGHKYMKPVYHWEMKEVRLVEECLFGGSDV